VDRGRLAQTKTNDKTKFVSVSLEEALQARKERREELAAIRESLG
jgi:allophanate hydrolase subunit 2